jgi:hypothetical protein
MSARVGVFTIASKNYLPYARVLFASLREHHPDFSRHLVLCDRPEGYFDPAQEDFEVLLAEDLPIERFRHVAFKYNLLELNTAVKPFAARLLFERHGLDALIYLDPDIKVYRPMGELLRALEDNDVVLTPHLTEPLEDDGRQPSELVMLQSGAYNLGFIALRAGEPARRLLAWWGRHCYDQCRNAQEEGLFVDQKWIDLVPGFFDRVCILRHPGYNAAYWGLPHRPISRDAEGRFYAAGQPLAFYHFSGFDPLGEHALSKFTDSHDLSSAGAAMRELCADYRGGVLAFGWGQTHTWPYSYGRFRGGPRIPDFLRSYFARALAPTLGPGVDPFDPADPSFSVYEHAQAPLEGGVLTTCALALHRSPMMQAATLAPEALDGFCFLVLNRHPAMRSLPRFPEVPGKDALAYARWFCTEAPAAVGLDEAYAAVVRRLIEGRTPKWKRGIARVMRRLSFFVAP